VFYVTFLETKDLYSPQENVSRLQEAIISTEIKELGGYNLFSLDTFEETLQDIDRRVGKPSKMLMNEKHKLLSQKPLLNHQRKETLKFITEIKKYSTLVDKIGSYQNRADYGLVLRLTKILPEKLFNGWMKEYTKLKAASDEVLISDLSNWLERQIDEIENILMIDAENPESTRRNNRNDYQKDKFAERPTREASFSQREDKKDEDYDDYKDTQNDSTDNYCWYHDAEGHSSLTCYSLLSKAGWEVTRLAKEKGICLICGRKAHAVCPFRNSNKCIIPDCTFHHAAIFCYKRRALPPTNSRTITNSSHNNRNPESRSGQSSQQNAEDDKKAPKSNERHTNSNLRNNQKNSSEDFLDALEMNAEESDNEEVHAHWTVVEGDIKNSPSKKIQSIRSNTQQKVLALNVSREAISANNHDTFIQIGSFKMSDLFKRFTVDDTIHFILTNKCKAEEFDTNGQKNNERSRSASI
jgi:hypothetical protein